MDKRPSLIVSDTKLLKLSTVVALSSQGGGFESSYCFWQWEKENKKIGKPFLKPFLVQILFLTIFGQENK
jgi:hypothetical protein